MSIQEYLTLLARLQTIDADIARIDAVLVTLAQMARLPAEPTSGPAWGCAPPAPQPTSPPDEPAPPMRKRAAKRVLAKRPTRARKTVKESVVSENPASPDSVGAP